ncbi:MAG: hypothetical protein NTV05_10715 [Acidobacteria bacterium]|nr:hypothetical protein [Acidobacteriota bacterium]
MNPDYTGQVRLDARRLQLRAASADTVQKGWRIMIGCNLSAKSRLMKNWIGAALFVAAAGLSASGCGASSTLTPTSPSPTSGTQPGGSQTMGSLSAGTWASSAGGAFPGSFNLNPGTCGNFRWSVTSLTPVSAAGTFGADCGGGLSLAGNATASLDGAGVVWGAAGNVTGSLTCTFAVTGTAALEDGGVRVNYHATVCGVSISGSELLKKR